MLNLLHHVPRSSTSSGSNLTDVQSKEVTISVPELEELGIKRLGCISHHLPISRQNFDYI